MLYQNTWRSDVIPKDMEGVMLYQKTWGSDVIPKDMEE